MHKEAEGQKHRKKAPATSIYFTAVSYKCLQYTRKQEAQLLQRNCATRYVS